MLKQIDYLYHFTKDIKSLKEIFKYGFKPSYSREMLGDIPILVPMVSFSNILLRDVGHGEVINYGDFGVCLTREWGVSNNLNPVVYTYKNGMLYNALNTFLFNSIFLSRLQDYKSHFEKFSNHGIGPFSKHIKLTNTSKEVLDILDYLSIKYDESLLNILSNHAKTIYETNFPILTLTKPYKVTDSNATEFIAYNDREWRKLYPDLKVVFDSEKEYDQWVKKPKPHFNDAPYLLKFVIEDIKAVLVNSEDDVQDIINELMNLFGKDEIDKLINTKSLYIGTKTTLEKNNF